MISYNSYRGSGESCNWLAEENVWRRLAFSKLEGLGLLQNGLVSSVEGGRQRLVASQLHPAICFLRSPLRCPVSRFSSLQHANAFVDEGQTDGQGKTFALAAFDGELATVLAHDAAYNQ